MTDFRYFRCDWKTPDPEEPVTFFYEVSPAGNVLRMIEVFAGGRYETRAVQDFAGRENELPGIGSLVEGSFYDGLELRIQPDAFGVLVVEIERDEFSVMWRNQRGY